MTDASPDERDEAPTQRIGTLERLGAVLLLAAVLGLLAVIVPGVVGFLSAGGASAWAWIGGAGWLVTAVLLAAGVRLVVERRRRGPTARSPEAGAVSVLLVVGVVVSAGAATWATVDRAANFSEQEVAALLTVVGDDLASDGRPTLGEVEAALVAEIEDPDVEDDVYRSDVEPEGLVVLEADLAGEAGDDAVFQVTDDDGGSPTCLRFLAQDDGPYEPVVHPGLC